MIHRILVKRKKQINPRAGIPLKSTGQLLSEARQLEQVSRLTESADLYQQLVNSDPTNQQAVSRLATTASKSASATRKAAAAAARKAAAKQEASAAKERRAEERRLAAIPSLFVISLRYLAPLEKIDAMLPKHLAFLDKHFDAGDFLAAGRQVPRTGGIVIARGKNRASVERIIKQDPFVKSKLASVEKRWGKKIG